MKTSVWTRCLAVGLAVVGVLGSASVRSSPVSAQPAVDPLVGAAGLGDPYYPDDGNGGYRVDHYDLGIGYDPPSRRLDGTARIDAVATQALRQFSLDFSGPDVSAVTVNNLPAGFTRDAGHKLSVTPALPVLPGLPFTVTVEYSGVQGNDPGEGWTISSTGGAFAAGEPHSASSWFPLDDTLGDKATYDLTATVPEQWQVISNGRQVGDTVADGNRTVHWASHQPMAGYLTTVAIDHFQFDTARRADGTPLVSAFAPGAESHRDVEQRLPEVLDFLESLYGPYPFDSGGGIYVDTDLKFSLETQTRPIYAPWTDLDTVVHENAHQWWGDSMSLQNWSDVCLNECLASYTADYLWPERKEGADVDQQYRDTVAEFRAQPQRWDIRLQDPGAGKEFSSVYSRGPVFLHALRRTIGDDAFFGALPQFVQSHAYGHASMPEFRQFIQSRTPVDLTGFFHAWLDETGIPSDEYLYPGSLRA